MFHRNRLWGCAFLSPLTALLIVLFSMPCAAQSVRVEPQFLKIGSFFGETDLRVWGQAPEGSDVVIEVIGKEVEQELMRKGRHWDLWMNVGEVDIEGAPRLYLVASSNPRLVDQPAATVPWGYEALRKRTVFHGQLKENEESRIFEQFVRLKESLRLYGIFPDAVKVSSDVESGATGQTVFRLNSRVSPGSYHVCVWAARNGTILKQECVPFTVAVVGLPAFLYSLSSGQPIIYGLLAVALGIVVGFLPGLLFTRKPKEEQK
jgi:Putative transmembrane protein (Alph_Pro_TM)